MGVFTRSGDTIFALASGLGKAAIAVFRISGSQSGAALAALTADASIPARQATLRTLRNPTNLEPIDRALVTRFQAPMSFTGEHMVELSITGGRAVTAAVVR